MRHDTEHQDPQRPDADDLRQDTGRGGLPEATEVPTTREPTHDQATDGASRADFADETSRAQFAEDAPRGEYAEDRTRAEFGEDAPRGEFSDDTRPDIADDDRREYADGEYTEVPTADDVGAAAPVDRPMAAQPSQMFDQDEADRVRGEWQRIQSMFVDDPQDAIRGADALLGEVIENLHTTHTERHETLRQSGTDTEELRQTLQRYRGFLDRLLDA
ncbi:hypothetical protein [Actinokineospora sp. HUAS TT18]|uniref:hypothetical protein n=1 Tax=Actinokineospora sp. HUAS TT18 TaxID=3447451 RepID=UPI003F520455